MKRAKLDRQKDPKKTPKESTDTYSEAYEPVQIKSKNKVSPPHIRTLEHLTAINRTSHAAH